MNKVYIVIHNDFDGVQYYQKVFAVCETEELAQKEIDNNPKLDLEYDAHNVKSK